MLLNLESYESISGLSFFAGFKVLVYDQDSYPFTYARAVEAAPGAGNTISVRYEEVSPIPFMPPWGCA